MATSPNTAAVQRVLATKLPGFEIARIKSLAVTIGKLQGKGLKVDEVFPEGSRRTR